MLQPRETDLPGLFLVLVVLPLVIYIFLGKWSETSKKKERVSLLAQLAAEEALGAEPMAAANVIPLIPTSPKNGIHECATCSGPATTRCSQCKSVRYCSGRCQIIHWRQGHKDECHQLETSNCPVSASNEEFIGERLLLNEKLNYQAFAGDGTRHSISLDASASAACISTDAPEVLNLDRGPTERQSHNPKLRREDGCLLDSTEEASRSRITPSNSSNKEARIRHKSKMSESVLSEEKIPQKQSVGVSSGCSANRHNSLRSSRHESHDLQIEHRNMIDSETNFGFSSLLSAAKSGTIECDNSVTDLTSSRDNFLREEISSNAETLELSCSSEMAAMKGAPKGRNVLQPPANRLNKSQKSVMKLSRELSCSETERKGQNQDDSGVGRTKDTILAQGGNGIANKGFMSMIGLRKLSKLGGQETLEVLGGRPKKLKMLFPYEEFVKLFQYEVFDLSPRGLINCGNSCYANAVLQCLMCTKPLTIYLLRRSHSTACCAKDWCLMCELEQHVITLRECGGPLSLGRILSHMRSINCQIGDGSQEDAHEFLRLLVASMQSICLEGLGGENVVDPILQETTFIQHTFGGRLKSKVKCLRCQKESERYENIMDLTLEIYGWVESLEDALTQFTTPEDLDGENMYRCGRCAAYVQARKQLSIHEAPNILTIVLKRFQEGSYGKINKCITFPDMLDMVPFMTGKDDIPPLYMLYAVIVHVDTLNASFSGHYISYIKDLQGNWFRIDDTEVQLVPMSQVMSEGAYILFYMRSSPCPSRAYYREVTGHQASGFVKHLKSRSGRPPASGQGKSHGCFVDTESSSNPRPNHTADGILRSVIRNRSPSMEFSDATSSDWSVFTSSDEASFTTESTRDSFSTVDYSDAGNLDPFSSIFSTVYGPEHSSHRTISCNMFSGSKPQTVFVSEGKNFILDSETFFSDHRYGFNVKSGSDLKEGIFQTSGHCIL
ncbi:Ubiquitinyl hydrolase 1 [Bertholletia excelsa]